MSDTRTTVPLEGQQTTVGGVPSHSLWISEPERRYLLDAEDSLSLAGLVTWIHATESSAAPSEARLPSSELGGPAAAIVSVAVVSRGAMAHDDYKLIMQLSASRMAVIVVARILTGPAVVRSLRCGATAVLTLHGASGQLRVALDSIGNGVPYLSEEALGLLIAQFSWNGSPMPISNLTPGESRVLRRLAQGGSNSEIATDLRVSRRTVKEQLARIYSKFEVSDRGAAIAKAYREGLVT